MEEFSPYALRKTFERFEKAAIRGHEESQWIWNVVKDMELGDWNWEPIVKGFAETENPLGYYVAGKFCEDESRERFDYMEKSSEGGCSWGQVEYSWYFHPDGKMGFVEKDEKMYLELLGKAVAQKNPKAICWKGLGRRYLQEYGEALVDFRIAAELGWRHANERLSDVLYYGHGVEKDLVQAVYWGSTTAVGRFWEVLNYLGKAWDDNALDHLCCDLSRLAMEIGKGLYWYQYQSEDWKHEKKTARDIGIKCLDYYCKTIELQQEAIFLFLLFWNKTTGVKSVGQMIGQIAWEGRYDCLVKKFGKEEKD